MKKKPNQYHDLHISIRSLKQNAKISGHYIITCRQHVKELEKEVVDKKKEVKNEKARLKRLGVRKIAFECGAKELELMALKLEERNEK